MDGVAGPFARLATDSSSFCVCYPKAGCGALMHKHGHWLCVPCDQLQATGLPVFSLILSSQWQGRNYFSHLTVEKMEAWWDGSGEAAAVYPPPFGSSPFS